MRRERSEESKHHCAWKGERGDIREHTSLCLEVGKGRNGGAHITMFGSRKREEIGKHASLFLEVGKGRNRGTQITVLGSGKDER